MSLLDKLTRVDMTPRILTKNKSGGTSKEEPAGLSPRSKQTPSRGLSMTPINNNQMSEIDKIIQEYAETLEEKLKLEPMTSDWIHRVIFFNTENLKVDLSTLISHERAEAERDLLAQIGINEDSLQANGYYAIAVSKEELEEYLSNERGK